MIREKVCKAYSAAAERPLDQHPFPVGRQFAESLGYAGDLLDELPPVCVDAFTGCSNVSLFADIAEGAAVLDLGCGSGLDSLIAARRSGSSGRVTGVDFSQAMLERARQARAPNVLFCRADAERLPIDAGAVEVALVNGLFNLNPAREAIFRELGRVVRPGGAVWAAELILCGSPAPDFEANESNWFA